MKPLIACLCAVLTICISASQAQMSTTSTRAAKGDTVWVIINHIKADKKAQFEKFITEVFWGMSKKLTGIDQEVFNKTRVLYPTKSESDGTFSYIFIMDPLISGGDYDIQSLLSKMYGPQKAAEYHNTLVETFAQDQNEYLEIQSDY